MEDKYLEELKRSNDLLEQINKKQGLLLSSKIDYADLKDKYDNLNEDDITDETIVEITQENENLEEILDAENEILEDEMLGFDDEVDESILEILATKILNQTLLELGFYADADNETIEAVELASIYDEDDLELMMLDDTKDKLIEEMNEFIEEDYYDTVITKIEELVDESNK